jgi:hypothetical protein
MLRESRKVSSLTVRLNQIVCSNNSGHNGMCIVSRDNSVGYGLNYRGSIPDRGWTFIFFRTSVTALRSPSLEPSGYQRLFLWDKEAGA